MSTDEDKPVALPPIFESILREIAALEEDVHFWIREHGGPQSGNPTLRLDTFRTRLAKYLASTTKTAPPAPESEPVTMHEPASVGRFSGQDVLDVACRNKRAYASPEAAGRAAEYARRNGSRDRLRTYLCPFGNDHYHLTKNTNTVSRVGGGRP